MPDPMSLCRWAGGYGAQRRSHGAVGGRSGGVVQSLRGEPGDSLLLLARTGGARRRGVAVRAQI